MRKEAVNLNHIYISYRVTAKGTVSLVHAMQDRGCGANHS